ncbi:MAG: VOC family protein [Planctomycetota bacterium]|nr:VOC family protein [Planctomycetota bacterium]
MIHLEHANITVKDIDVAKDFLLMAIPEFRVRHQGFANVEEGQRRWIHIGNDHQYIAMEDVSGRPDVERTPYRDIGVNHFGFVTEDLNALIKRLTDAGYQQQDLHAEGPYRRRAYFLDPTGFEWEFVEYLTEDPKLKNDYSPATQTSAV